MTRRKFSREFKIEAVKLVTERDVSVSQACRDLDLAESVLRRWMREAASMPSKNELAKLKAARDLLKNLSRPSLAVAATPPPVTDDSDVRREEPDGDPNLRSTGEVSGCYVVATDGSIGHVEDFIVDVCG